MFVLQEELIKAKSSAPAGSRNVRDSLNQLRVSLNRSFLPRIDDDSDEDVNVDEDDVKELGQQLTKLHSSCEEDIGDGTCEPDLMSEDDDFHSSEEKETEEFEEIDMGKSQDELPPKNSLELADNTTNSEAINPETRSGISISLCCRSPILQDPTLTESPKIGNTQRKSVTFSSSCAANQNNVTENSKFKSDVVRQSLENIQSSLRSSKIFQGPTESLAASLQRGLQIIDYHQQNSALNKSTVSFSFEHLALKPSSAQTLPETRPSIDEPSVSFLCASCKRRVYEDDTNEVQDSLKTLTIAVDEAGNSKPMKEVR